MFKRKPKEKFEKAKRISELYTKINLCKEVLQDIKRQEDFTLSYWKKPSTYDKYGCSVTLVRRDLELVGIYENQIYDYVGRLVIANQKQFEYELTKLLGGE